NTRGSMLESKRKRETETQKESEEDLGLWKEQFHEFIDTKTNASGESFGGPQSLVAKESNQQISFEVYRTRN
ncbi:hypothetical protein scyTo_0020292, partial [Scyliorhinus torazame]|nr:hypothetical protein [Scyliorhinus torazame]